MAVQLGKCHLIDHILSYHRALVPAVPSARSFSNQLLPRRGPPDHSTSCPPPASAILWVPWVCLSQ